MSGVLMKKELPMITISLTDTQLSGKELGRMTVALPTSQTTARALITARIHREIEVRNQREPSARYHPLVQPLEAEAVLNQQGSLKVIDPAIPCERAIRAFSQNAFFLLVDDRQVTDLDAPLPISEVSTVQFIRLVPLVGG